MENNAGVETRLYYNTSVFTDMINQMVILNSIN